MTDIKKIIHIADVHIPNVEEDKPYSQMIENFIFECCKVCADYNKDEVRIVLAVIYLILKIKYLLKQIVYILNC